MVKYIIILLLFLLCTNVYAIDRELTIGSNISWAPMEFFDSKNQTIGFAIDILNAMGRVGKFKPIIKNVSWEDIFVGLYVNQYDVISSSVSITEKRKKLMDFSDPYFTIYQAVLVRKDSNIMETSDLKGKMVGAQINTTGFFAANKLDYIKISVFDNIKTAIEDLINKDLDAVICDDVLAANYTFQDPTYSKQIKIGYLIMDAPKEYYGFVVRKGDIETLNLLNSSLKAIKSSNEYYSIKAKWFDK